MQGAADHPRKTIAIFLMLTFALSAVTWVPQIREGKLDPIWVTATMWSPGIAAILTKLITQRDLRGMGWMPKPGKLLGLAYVLPILYALPVYLLAWTVGLGTFDEGKWIVAPGLSPPVGLLIIASAGLFTSLLSALGEEIGWRGLLVPELTRLTSFRNTALISGGIWAAWHMPLLFAADYHGQGTPILYSMACFVAMVLAISIIMAWITLKSGSLWPAAMLHAAHNLFVQGVFDSATVADDRTNYLTGEFGIGLVITIAIAAFLLIRMYPIVPKEPT
ncbi:MAG: CPBP family intramembrane glutamic endopeptidase [Sphingomicrobium sp.]